MSKQIPLQRIKWIDLTKGVAIFLMVCGHTGIPSLISNWIWSFHMPLFFIISGMLFCPTKYTNIQKFIHRRNTDFNNTIHNFFYNCVSCKRK